MDAYLDQDPAKYADPTQTRSSVLWNHNYLQCSGSGSGSGSDFLTSYGSGYGSGSTSQKVTVPTVPVPVPQHWSAMYLLLGWSGVKISPVVSQSTGRPSMEPWTTPNPGYFQNTNYSPSVLMAWWFAMGPYPPKNIRRYAGESNVRSKPIIYSARQHWCRIKVSVFTS